MILVTGAGGTVGGELVKQLQASGTTFGAGYHSPEMAEKAKRAGLCPHVAGRLIVRNGNAYDESLRERSS